MDAHFDEHAIRCVGCPNLTLKPERQSVRHVYAGKDIFLWYSQPDWQVVMLRNATIYLGCEARHMQTIARLSVRIQY